ncbi:MAG: hypothetical protein RL708_1779 [Bacteroidota bacterium]|jgi:hypothetical protein
MGKMILQIGIVTAAIEYYIFIIRKMKNRIGNWKKAIGNSTNRIGNLKKAIGNLRFPNGNITKQIAFIINPIEKMAAALTKYLLPMINFF